MQAKLDDRTFMSELESIGPAALSKKYGMSNRAVYSRRKRVEARYGTTLVPPRRHAMNSRKQYAHRVNLDILNGIVLVGSDAHIWPGALTTAMRAFIRFCGGVPGSSLPIRAVIMNGDVMDFPQISRHDPIGWEDHPTVADELAAAQAVLRQIEDAVPRNCKLAWSAGNHDMRMESRIASLAPEMARVKGVHLKDHFGERWTPCWSVFINDDVRGVVVKHRYSGGVNATRNNALKSGRSIVTGHLHSANVRGLTDYNGTRWGVDTGCLAEPSAQAFVNYTEDAPLDWRSGFAVLTFVDGILLQPELCLTFAPGVVQFRGELIRCDDARSIRPAPATASRRAVGSSTRKPARTMSRTMKNRSTAAARKR